MFPALSLGLFDHFFEQMTKKAIYSTTGTSDYYLTLGALMFFTIISLVTTFIVDMSYGVVDPRIRMGGKKQ